jgi:hypothetical protein
MSRLVKALLSFGIGSKGFEVTIYPNSYDISEPYKDKANPPNCISISRKQADAIREIQEVMSKYKESENE